MKEQQKNEISRINQQIAVLEEKITVPVIETKKRIEKRDKLNEQVKRLRQEIRELKNERNSLNEKVRTMKQQRDGMRTKIRTIIEEIKTKSRKITGLRKRT